MEQEDEVPWQQVCIGKLRHKISYLQKLQSREGYSILRAHMITKLNRAVEMLRRQMKGY